MPARFKRKRRTGRKKVPKTVKTYVKRAVQAEIERKETSVTGVLSPSTTASMVDLSSSISQGITDRTRIGDKCKPKYLQVNALLVVADLSNFVRFVFFVWKQNTILASPVTNLIWDDTGGVTPTLALMNHDTKQASNFKVLKDKTFYIADVAHTGAANPEKLVKFRINLKNCPATYFDAGNSTGTNHIYMGVVSDSSAAAHPSVTYTAHLAYTDG